MKRRTALFLALAMSVLCVFAFPAAAEEAAGEDVSVYADILRAFDYGPDTVYVIGHKSPDSDTVGSAMAYAGLLNALDIPAQAVISAPVNPETAYALNFFGLEAPPVMDHAEGKQFVLVDHSTYTQAIDGMEDALIVGILDHHGLGNVTTDKPINITFAPVGSTATLVCMACEECGVEISREMAQAMLMGLISDTNNMNSSVTLADRIAYDTLLPLTGLTSTDELYAGMADALVRYVGMSDRDIFLSDYKEYESAGTAFGIASINAVNESAMPDLTDRMMAVMKEMLPESGLDMLFVIIHNKNEEPTENQTCLAAWAEDAQMILEKVYGPGDETGRHMIREHLSRKSDVVPALMGALE